MGYNADITLKIGYNAMFTARIAYIARISSSPKSHVQSDIQCIRLIHLNLLNHTCYWSISAFLTDKVTCLNNDEVSKNIWNCAHLTWQSTDSVDFNYAVKG